MWPPRQNHETKRRKAAVGSTTNNAIITNVSLCLLLLSKRSISFFFPFLFLIALVSLEQSEPFAPPSCHQQQGSSTRLTTSFSVLPNNTHQDTAFQPLTMTNFVDPTLQRMFNDTNNSLSDDTATTNEKKLQQYGSSVIDDHDDGCCSGSRKLYRKFAVGYSTERHFRIGDDETPAFYGAYGYVRKQLDYTFHQHYRKGTCQNVFVLGWLRSTRRLNFTSYLPC